MTVSFLSRVRSACALSAAALAVPAYAMQPLITDDTGTQGAGRNQIELSHTREHARAAGAKERLLENGFTYTRGITDSLDLYASGTLAQIDGAAGRSSGTGNPVLGAKWRFFEDEATRLSLGLKPEWTLPVSAGAQAAGLGSGRHAGGVTFILQRAWDWGSLLLNASLGWERFRDPALNPTLRSRRLSVAPVWRVDERWQLALDTGWSWDRAGGQSVRSRFLELGVVHSLNDDLELALGLIHSASPAAAAAPASRANSITAGLTWRF